MQKEVKDYIHQLDPSRVDDIKKLIEIGTAVTKKEPIMWGSMVGFGKIHYKYVSKREGDTFEFGLASRKKAITLYLGWDVNQYEGLKKLGKHKTGVGCLYIDKLADVDLNILIDMIKESVKSLKTNPIITDIQ
ncbi:MAG: DUF1801 domain-containing protein [Acholeplasmataceae bacterium]|nr:DUF1801 domain-containing protein [Acholeplasmataceae bacterium]